MSDSAKTTPAKKAAPEPKAATPAETKTAETKSAETKSADAAPAAASEPGERKVGRAAMGGEAVGHYGFFSNIKTPEYKSGWDAIWGKKKAAGGGKAKKAKGETAAPARAAKAPQTVALDFADLPAAAREALADAARARLGRGKGAYDRADRAGKLSWTIELTVPR